MTQPGMRPSKGEAAQAQVAAGTGQAASKSQLRQEMRRILQGISAEARIQCSKGVCQQLERHDAWRQASSVLFYAALGDELDLGNLLETALLEKKLVALPQFDPGTGAYRASAVTTPVRELRAGRYGIPEPDSSASLIPLKQLDLILVPGLAFDLNGRRLGRGGGYYDRLLEHVNGLKCGVAFEAQLRDCLPIEDHDVLLNCLVTPARWLEFHGDGNGNERVR